MTIAERLDLARANTLTLGVLMERLAALHGDRTMVQEADGFTTTFTGAADLVDRWAGVIADRTDPGDRVVLAVPNGYEQFLLVLAASRAGRRPAPVNDHMTPAEIDHVVADSGASLVIEEPAELGEGRPHGPAVPADPRDVGALFYTSGTTGKPKGAQLTHRGLIGSMSMSSIFPRRLARDEMVFALPVAHIFGFGQVIMAAAGGMPTYFFGRFNPVKVLDAIEQRRSTVYAGVPAMYKMLLEAGAEERDLKSIRLWISGADAMPAELSSRFKGFGATMALPVVGPVGEAIFAEGYGMVETAGGVALRISPPVLPVGIGGSVGLPIPGNSFKVVDPEGEEVPRGGVGELWLKGPGVLKGYHGAPDATKEALTQEGWLRTGDLARRGWFGLVNFEGRMKDVIKRGGYSVYAVEVEQTLEEHPEVVEAAVVPFPDARDGEVPVAVVRTPEGVDAQDLDLVAWARERMSSYKVPVRVVQVDRFPRTGTDKIQHRDLAAIIRDLPADATRADVPAGVEVL